MSTVEPTAAAPEPITLTLFGSGEYSQGKPLIMRGGWPQFFGTLRDARPAKTTDKRMLLSWSPTIFESDKRLIKLAKTLCACVLDYDGGETSLEAALALWQGTMCFGHTSWSATSAKETFRVVLPYPRLLTVAEHERVRKYVWRTAQGAGHVLDKSCKDPSRLWYVGNNGRHYRTLWQDGAPLDVDDILALTQVEELADEVVPEGNIITTTVAEPGSREAIEQARKYLDNKVSAVSGHHGHDTTRGVALALVWGFGLSEEQALSLMATDYNPRCQPSWSQKELAHKVEGVLEWAKSNSGGKPRGHFLQQRRVKSPAPPTTPTSAGAATARTARPATTTDAGEASTAITTTVVVEGVFDDESEPRPTTGEVGERPQIPITTEEPHVNDQAIAALSLDRGLYARGSALVRIQRGSIATLPMAILRERMAGAAVWLQYVAKKDAWAQAHPPEWSVAAVYCRGQWPGMRELAGVVTSPTLLADGRVLTTEGYDGKSGLYYEPTEDWGNLAALERPTKADAVKAQKILLDLAKDFEFQEPIDRTCWLAEVLTVESRHAHTGNLPHYVHTANLKGTGKGKLAQLTAIIATGETVAEGTLSEDEAEREKRLCGLSISGAPVVLFDEMTEVGGQTLQMVATSRRFRGRVLGETGVYTGPWDTVVVYAGNNVVTTMDMNRRTVPVRLFTKREKPWTRTDFEKEDLVQWAKEHRRDLHVAALTMLRAYMVAGRPPQTVGQMGSYEPWKSLVASCLVWLGQGDVTSAVAREDSDEDARKIEGLMVAWDTVFGSLTVRIGDVLRYCESGGIPPRSADTASTDAAVSEVAVGLKSEDAQKLLTSAVCAFCAPKGTAKLPLAATLGKALGAVARRNVGGRLFEAEWHANLKQQVWKLVAANAIAELAGDAGDDEKSTRNQNPGKHAIAGDAGDAGDDPSNGGKMPTPANGHVETTTVTASSGIPAPDGQPSPAPPASPASLEKQADRLRVENPVTPASPAASRPQGYFIGLPVWMGPLSALPSGVHVYELHGTPRGQSLAVFAIEVDRKMTRIAVDIGNDERAHRWSRPWRWSGEWADDGLVGFGDNVGVRLVLRGGFVTTLSTIDPNEDLTPSEWSVSFRLQWARMPQPQPVVAPSP